MRNVRIISRLDVKAPNLIKGVHLEGFRKLGQPVSFARRYYEQGIDEIIYMDIVASLYERNGLYNLVSETADNIFVPLTLGGGIRTLDDVQLALRHGADKVAVNTAAIKNPDFITQIANRFGSQCIVLSVEAKRTSNNTWEALYDNGRERSGKNVIDWVKQAELLGAGEILLTSVDREGTEKGFDIELVKQVTNAVNIPVIASGGMGNTDDFIDVAQEGHADGISIASVLHYDKLTVDEIRAAANKAGIHTRKIVEAV